MLICKNMLNVLNNHFIHKVVFLIMDTSIPIKDKRFFLQWFLKHYELKNYESRWLLEYLLTDEILLSNIHFTRQAEYCPRAIIVTATCSKEISFRFHKKHVMTTDVDKSFHDLRLKKHEPMYLQINFAKSYQNPYYLAVLEENPYAPKNIQLSEQDRQNAENILKYSLQEYKLKRLKQKIDVALETNNREEFHQLVDELNQIKKQ